MKCPPSLRNTHAAVETKRAAPLSGKVCKRCKTPIRRGKTYCAPCASIRYDETVAANKARYKAQRKNEAGLNSGISPDNSEKWKRKWRE